MKQLLALPASALLAAGLWACGDSSPRAGSIPHASSSATASDLSPAPLVYKADRDKDNDISTPINDADNNGARNFGHAASAAERRAITTLIKRYYATALAGDGARGCSMIYSTIAESAPEDDSREPGTPAYMHGAQTCAAVLTALFKHYHAQLAAEVPRLEVTRVRLKEHHGFALLSFGTLPEREISVLREGRVWKLSQIYDVELP